MNANSASSARTAYVVITNGHVLPVTFSTKERAIRCAQSYVEAAEDMWPTEYAQVHTVEARTVTTGKIVFSREVIVPAKPVKPVQAPATVQPGTYYPNVPGAKSIRDSRPLYVGDERVSVGVESDGLAYIFLGCRKAPGGWGVDVSALSYPEFYAWVHKTVTNPSPSPFCADVARGCAHTMAMSEEGHGVACVEYADAQGIEWRQNPSAPVISPLFDVKVNLTRNTCGWCTHTAAPYAVRSEGWTDYACRSHLIEWFASSAHV